MNAHPSTERFAAIESRPSPRTRVPQPSANPTNLLTLPEVAAELSISTRGLHRLIASGEFPRPMKIGHGSRFPRSDLEAYLEKLRRQRGEKLGTA